MISLILSVALLVFSQACSYAMESEDSIIDLPHLQIKYPAYSDRLQGYLHRTFKFSRNWQNISSVINSEGFRSCILEPRYPKFEKMEQKDKERVEKFIAEPLQVTVSLKCCLKGFDPGDALKSIQYFNLIKHHTVSYYQNPSKKYYYDNKEGKTEINSPGDIILFIPSNISQRMQIVQFKNDLEVIRDLFSQKIGFDNLLYFRASKKHELDIQQDPGNVLYVTDVKNFLLFKQ